MVQVFVRVFTLVIRCFKVSSAEPTIIPFFYGPNIICFFYYYFNSIFNITSVVGVVDVTLDRHDQVLNEYENSSNIYTYVYIYTTDENTFLKKLLVIFRIFSNLLRTSLLGQKHCTSVYVFAIVAK